MMPGPPISPKKETARISVPGPKKETARITVLPNVSAPSAPVQMKKTQPLSRMPEMVPPPSVPMNVAVREPEVEETELVGEEIPVTFYWAVLGISAAVLIIQIWIYIS